MPEVHLTAKQHKDLASQLKYCKDARTYRRILGILETAKGRPVSEIAAMLGVERKSVYNWIDGYLSSPGRLEDRPRSGRPSVWNQRLLHMFEEALKCRPEQYGFRSTEWTAALLREYVHTKAGILLSENTIRNQVHLLGYTWKRPRYILEPDPDQEKKKANSQENTEFAASIRSFI